MCGAGTTTKSAGPASFGSSGAKSVSGLAGGASFSSPPFGAIVQPASSQGVSLGAGPSRQSSFGVGRDAPNAGQMQSFGALSQGQFGGHQVGFGSQQSQMPIVQQNNMPQGAFGGAMVQHAPGQNGGQQFGFGFGATNMNQHQPPPANMGELIARNQINIEQSIQQAQQQQEVPNLMIGGQNQSQNVMMNMNQNQNLMMNNQNFNQNNFQGGNGGAFGHGFGGVPRVTVVEDEQERETDPDKSKSGGDWAKCMSYLQDNQDVTWEDLVSTIDWASNKRTPAQTKWYRSRTSRKAFATHWKCAIPQVLLTYL